MSDAAMPVESAEAAGDYGTYGENGVAVAGCEGDGGENAAEILAISISSKVNDDAGEGTATDTDTGHRVSLSGKPLLTLDEMSERLGFGCFHVELLFVVSAIWMADAMEMMLISFVSPPLQCYFDLTDAEKAAITSVVFVGMFFGSTSWGYFQDHVGRKIGYYVSVAWVRGSWLINTIPRHLFFRAPATLAAKNSLYMRLVNPCSDTCSNQDQLAPVHCFTVLPGTGVWTWDSVCRQLLFGVVFTLYGWLWRCRFARGRNDFHRVPSGQQASIVYCSRQWFLGDWLNN